MLSPGILRVFVLLSLLLTSGCATIRKLNPIESHTLEARRLTQQAEAAIHKSEWNDAETKLVRAIERCPEDTRARSVLADVLWERGARSAAVEQKARSIQLAGGRDAWELTELGQMQLSTGNFAQALQHAEEAISQNGELADAWTLKGFALNVLDRPDDALGAFYRSLSIRNDDSRTRMEIASIYRAKGELRRALAILGDAPSDTTEFNSSYPDACYLRGLLLGELNRPSDAALAFASAKERGCTAPDLLFHLANAQLTAGERLAARATLADANQMEHAPEVRVALAELGKQLELSQSTETPTWR